MSEEGKFNLEKIISESSKKLKNRYPDADTYITQIANSEMQTRLTPGEISAITQNLLNKVGFKGDAP